MGHLHVACTVANLNNLPRGIGGSEEAHDYCWLTQNLWEAQDVWTWADGDEAKRYVLKPCSRRGCARREGTVREFKRCSACKQTVYCSTECQKDDWTSHKPGTAYVCGGRLLHQSD